MQDLVADLSDIRNALDLRWGDNEILNDVIPDSVEKYGRRFMRLPLDKTTNIDTLAEAERMWDAIMADLSEPFADATVLMRYFWMVKLCDLFRFVANNVHHSEDLDLAVVAYEHTIEDGDGITLLTVRGKPAGPSRRFLDADAEAKNVIISEVDPQNDAPIGTLWAKVVYP
jgi:hypothetical protein